MPLDLAGWQPPDRGALFVVVGSSGTGKSTLVRSALARFPALSFSVSATTRAPRAGERDGVDYRFISRRDFDDLLAQDAFLEWAEVYGNRYGTPRREVLDAMSRGESLIVEVDTEGARQIRARMPEAVLVFILPPSRECLEARLRRRGTDAEEVIARRVHEADIQMRECGWFDYLVVNDLLSSATDAFHAILVAEMLKRSRRDTWVQRALEQASP
jgi:guanylate kinase